MINIKPLKYILPLVLLLLSSLTYAGTEDRKYRIIVDGSSTRTFLYLYQYDYHDALPYNLKILLKSRIYPGIAMIKNKDIDAYLKRLFHDQLALKLESIAGKDNRGPGALKLSRIQFYTTGGMRALPKSVQDEKNKLIKDWLDKWLMTHSVIMDKADKDIRTLSGEEEAAYAWVGENYLESLFNGSLSGVAMINGASTQIAYQDNKYPNIEVQVANKKYAITGRSFPLGQNVIKETLSKEDGCYLRGFKFSATGNYVRCRVAAKAMINKQRDPGVHNASKVAKYRLYANFYYSAEFFNIEKNYSLAELQKAAEIYCTTTWEDAKENHPGVNRNYLALYCMGAAFQGALLEDTYYFSDDKQELTTKSRINGLKITWPIGALVSQSYRLLN
jgi:hypothetical protein